MAVYTNIPQHLWTEAFNDSETRVRALQALNLIDSPVDEPCFGAVAALGTKVFSMPICMITLVDKDRVYIKASSNLLNRTFIQGRNLSRRHSLCTFATHAESPDVTVFSGELHLHPILKENIAVINGIRFYAGTPLRLSDGITIGALCLLDLAPRKFGLHSKAQLMEMALLASTHIDERRRTLQSHLRYFSTMAHNLRSPLNGLELCIEAMEKPREQWIWEQTKSNLNSMKKIVEKGLGATKRTTFFETTTLNPKKIETVKLKEKIFNWFSTLPPNDNIKTEFIIDPSCPEVLFCDITIVFDALLALLVNSLQAVKTGKITITISSHVPNEIKITVTDTGKGVRSEYVPQLFRVPIDKVQRKGIFFSFSF